MGKRERKEGGKRGREKKLKRWENRERGRDRVDVKKEGRRERVRRRKRKERVREKVKRVERRRMLGG